LIIENCSDEEKAISLKVNGRERAKEVSRGCPCFDIVREQFGLTGAKLRFGCDIKRGACTLLPTASR